jgi:hypothetical protein
MVISFGLLSLYCEKKDPSTFWVRDWLVSERGCFSDQEGNIFVMRGFHSVIDEGYCPPEYDAVLIGN